VPRWREGASASLARGARDSHALRSGAGVAGAALRHVPCSQATRVDSLASAAREALLNRRAVLDRDEEASTETDRHELEEIDAALQRIAGGGYGQCEICGGAIGRGRLRAMPEARRCMRCE
jgi:DnaK suppressor protein